MTQPIAPTLPTAATHEFRTLHFDLGHLRYGGPLELIAAGRKVALERHTEESIAALRATLPPSVAAKAKLERLTHTAREVPLRSTDIKLLHVRAVRPANPSAADSSVPLGILAAGLHIPATIRPRCLASARKRSHFGLQAEDDSSFLQDLFTTDDTATVVIFLHPDSVNFDPGTFDLVYNAITASGMAAYLDDSIEQQGENWVASQPITNLDGTQWYDANGNPGYMSLYSGQTCSDALMPMQIVVQGIKDNLALQGHNWTAIQGLACIATGPQFSSSIQKAARGEGEADSGPTWAIQNQSPAGGLTLGNLTAGTQDGFTTLQIGFDNLYSRHLSVYVEYLDANGDVIDLSDLTFPAPNDPGQDKRFRAFDTSTARLLDVLQPQTYFSGIPLTFLNNTYTVTVPIPADSVGGIASVNLLCGGMGSGPWTYPSNVEMIGTVLTAIFEYGFPVILAAVDMGVDNSILSGWFSSNTADLLVNEGLLALAAQLPITEWGPNNWQAFLTPVIEYAVTYVIPTFGKALFAAAPEVVAEASDPIGWIAAAVSITMTVLSLAATTSDVLQSPPVYSNTLSYSMTISITLLPDRNDPNFPEVATNYSVILRFTNGTTVQRFDGNVSPDTPSLPPVVFNNIPAGGTMTAQVIFYSADGWIAGQALWQGQCALQDGQPVMNLTIQITEHLVPLTSATVYSHVSMLEYVGGGHQWVPGPPPQDVSTSLIYGTPPYCSQLQSLTYAVESVSPTESEGVLGYTWQATSNAIAQCGQSSGGASVYLSQVLSSSNPPDSALAFSGCGISGPASVAFDLSNPSANGFFYIDPRNDAVFVRRFDPSQSPYPQNSLSCGSLYSELSVDDLAIFQSKFLVAINTNQSKLQIVHLSETDGDDSVAPAPRMLSGFGTRPGLMNSPVAVAVAKDGTILVLENGNSRLQAFDEYGGPLMQYFAGSPFMPLANPAAGQVFLDLAVESTGYIYILSQLPPVNDDLVYTDYVLDVYTPQGAWLCQSAGIAAAKMDVDHWRNVWALNYHLLISPPGGINPAGTAEPSVSLWVPSAP